MPVGGDKGFAFDPPGAIGLWFDDARVMLKLHDPDVAVPPRDEAGALDDLLPPVGAVAPQVVGAAMGQGRAFWPGLLNALAAKDLSTGSSLATRDCTIMAIVAWDVAGQALAGAPGTLVCRGDSSGAAEFVAYELRFVVVNAAARTGSLVWSWQDTAGAVHTQAGAQFTCPTGFTLITATRRWVSPTEVMLRYYIGDNLIGEVTSSDGSIGGGVTGTFLLGANRAGGVNLGGFFAGIVDEIAIFGREMCLEEIEDTWLRITVYQPLGVQLYREMHDDGFPQSLEPSSDVQLENRWIGMTLGFAASRFENIRRNLVPQRAYGRTLEDWEKALRPTTQPGQSFDERRARVVARLQQRLGSSPDGFRTSLAGLLGSADPSQLEFLAYANTVRDEFETEINPLRWDIHPAAAFTVASAFAQATPPAGTYLAGPTGGWLTAAMSVSQSGVRNLVGQEHALAGLGIFTSQSGLEAGIFFADRAANNYILLGLRDVAGVFKIQTEVFTGWASGGAVVQATLGANPAALFLHLHRQADGTWIAEWSTTSDIEGFTASAPIAAFGTSPVFWSGMYVRSTGAIAGAADVRFDFFTLRTPFGTRPLNAYVMLDRALGFSPDIPGARQIVDTIKHLYVNGSFITSPNALCDDLEAGCDTTPCGGLL